MSKLQLATFKWAIPVLAGVFLLLPALSAHGQSFKDYEKTQTIAAQKKENEIKNQLAEARKLEAKNPVKALDILGVIRFYLESDTQLNKTTKATLLRTIDQRISQIEKRDSARKKTATPPKKEVDPDDIFRKQAVKKATENGGPGRKSVYNTAKRLTGGIRERLASQRRYRLKMEKGRLSLFDSIDRTAANTPTGDYTLPRNWREISKRRKLFSGPRLTKQEKDLLRAMNSVISVDFDATPFKSVLKFLRKRTGQTIFVNPNSLKDADVSYETKISLKGEKLTVRTILRKVLGDVGLTYILKDGVIQVMTEAEARKTQTIKSYPIAGLLPPPVPGAHPAYNQGREIIFANQIMSTIFNTVGPTSWSARGGKGSMWYDPVSKTIFVRQSAELHLPVHRAIGSRYGR